MVEPASMRVLIADDALNVRQALWLMCEEGLGLKVVGAASDTAELLTLAKTTHPDLLLLEWGLPGSRSSELIEALVTQTALAIIVLGGDIDARAEALEAGAYAFIYKGEPPERLLRLLQTLRNNRASAN